MPIREHMTRKHLSREKKDKKNGSLAVTGQKKEKRKGLGQERNVFWPDDEPGVVR